MQARAVPTNSSQLWFTWTTVFSKTAKGREEVTQRLAGLNLKERSVLIMLDGIKRIDKLLTAIPQDELGRIIDHLAKQQLIQVTAVEEEFPERSGERSNTASENTAYQHSSPEKLIYLEDIVKLREVKDFMASTAHTYLGLLSADLIHRVEKAKNAPQLMAVVGQWYIALRDSKHGHRFASDFMKKTLATLRGEYVDNIAFG